MRLRSVQRTTEPVLPWQQSAAGQLRMTPSVNNKHSKQAITQLTVFCVCLAWSYVALQTKRYQFLRKRAFGQGRAFSGVGAGGTKRKCNISISPNTRCETFDATFQLTVVCN